jgi:preprotein translocase subunit SecG
MYWALIVLHVIVCTFLVLVVLLQAGKGGGIGIAFGGGGSQTVFGSSGAGNFLTRLTAICATIFFLNSLGLAYLSSRSDSTRLQKLAEQKAATKKADDEAKNKVIKDVEKAREALKTPGTETPAATPPAATPPAEGSAKPAETKAPAPAAEKPAAPAQPAEKPANPSAPAQ